MARTFKRVDYEAVLEMEIRLGDVLPADHLARFVVEVVAELDLSAIYGWYSDRGAPPYAPEIMVGLLFYGYATGVFSSRKIEKKTHEEIPFRYIAGNLHPDHSTIAEFRQTFLGEIKEVFVQILLIAQEMGLFKLGNISLDGSKIRANASKHKAVSYKRLLSLEKDLQAEVEALFALAEQAEEAELPEGLVIADEVALRRTKLAQLAEAKQVLAARAAARYEVEQAEYEAKLAERAEKERQRGRKLGGRPPKPPQAGVRDKDQYNFTDPPSRIMKNPTDQGFDQHYNVQAAVDQASLLVVGPALSNHPNDQQEALPTLDAIPPEIGQPPAAALDNGYFSQDNINAISARGIEPYIAVGREAHQPSWQAYFAQQPGPPPPEASPKEKMAYKLQTEIGQAIYRLRKCTVEPVIGIIKEVLGFRQFSLRGLEKVAGEWTLVCIAFNLKRMHTLYLG
jgi:transposase